MTTVPSSPLLKAFGEPININGQPVMGIVSVTTVVEDELRSLAITIDLPAAPRRYEQGDSVLVRGMTKAITLIEDGIDIGWLRYHVAR